MEQDPLLIDLPEVLRGERLVLRAYRPTDAAALWHAVDESRAHLAPWMPWVQGYSGVDDARRFIARTQARWLLRDGELTFGIHAAGGPLLGSCGLKPLNWGLRTFEIGYWLRAGAGGRGHMTEAVRLVTALAFDRLGATRVQIRADAGNRRSQRVAERCGYRLEGTLRRSGPPIPGATAPADCQVFGLLPEEYRALPWAAAPQAVPVAAPIADFRVRIRASAVILDADGRVLLVRQFPGSDLWLPPGGGVEPGELCQEAVVREVREETGLAVACGRLLWMRDAVHHHGTDKVRQHLDVCFWADVLHREPGPAEHEWGYFARDRMPSDNVLLPPDFWSAVDGGFRDHDPGAGATHRHWA